MRALLFALMIASNPFGASASSSLSPAVPSPPAPIGGAGVTCTDLLSAPGESQPVHPWIEQGCNNRPVVPRQELLALETLIRSDAVAPSPTRKLLDALYQRVGIEIAPEGFALLYDTLNSRLSAPQDFGAFPGIVDGRVATPDLEPSVNTRRDRIGLPPLEDHYAHLQAHAPLGSLPPAPLAKKFVTLPRLPLLRRELMIRRGRDLHVQSPQTSAEVRAQVQHENHEWVRKLLMTRGFPTEHDVGRSGLDAIFYLVQHSPDAELLDLASELAEPRVRSGQMARSRLALMSDRRNVLQRQAQIYGTQYGVDRLGEFMYPTEDMDRVNTRRLDMRLEPLELDRLPPQRWPNQPADQS